MFFTFIIVIIAIIFMGTNRGVSCWFVFDGCRRDDFFPRCRLHMHYDAKSFLSCSPNHFHCLKKYEGKSDPPSIEAAKKGDLESMRILASAGHNVAKIVVNRYGETPLHHVAFGSDNVAFAKFLLSNTHNKSSLLNAKTNSGITALHWAVQTNHYKLVAFLLASGADHTAKTQYGNTALDVAVAMQSVESVNILKKRYNCLKTGGSGEGKRDVSQI